MIRHLATAVAASPFCVGCQPQQTYIVAEIHRPDGTVVRYVNKGSGYGYNPNIIGTVQANSVVSDEGAVLGTPMPTGWGWGGWWGSAYPMGVPTWGCGGLNPWAYNPGVAWNSGIRPADPCRPAWP